MNTWKVKIITAHPEFFPGPLEKSLIGKALDAKLWSLEIINLHEFSYNSRGSVDDYPFGGGPGMIIRPDVLEKAIKKSMENMESNIPLVYMTPVGEPLVQKTLKNFSIGSGVIIICGRFEGIDERVLNAYNIKKISLGDFILSGGEVAAIAFLEGCIRLMPGVLGKEESLINESFNDGFLEHPQYTRPKNWIDDEGNEHKVPEVLLSGNHEKIIEWKKNQSIEITKKNRPDIIKKKLKESKDNE